MREFVDEAEMHDPEFREKAVQSFDYSRQDLIPYGFSCSRWSPTIMTRADRHNEIELNFLNRGWLTYLLGGEVVRVEAGRLVAFWAAIPHQIIDHGGDAAYFVVTLPLAWFLRCRFSHHFVQNLLHGQMIVTPSDNLLLDRLMLEDWERDLGNPSGRSPAATLLELESRLRRMARAFLAGNPKTPRSSKRSTPLQEGGFVKAEQMAHLIAQRFSEKLTIELFAREMKLNRKHAIAVFQQVFGTTLADYVCRYRISNAQRLLVMTKASVVEIASSVGFESLSHFNRMFQKNCGCSPREYRLRSALGGPSSTTASHPR
jgi:AraC-like DNA-binding protein